MTMIGLKHPLITLQSLPLINLDQMTEDLLLLLKCGEAHLKVETMIWREKNKEPDARSF